MVRSVTGILQLVNKTPVDWYSSKQITVDTATYGSEFVSARTCVEHIIYLMYTLWYIGVTFLQKSYIFVDNKYVVDSSIYPYAKIHKRHIVLSFHHFWEAIEYKMVTFYRFSGGYNLADILSKISIYNNI